MLVVGSRALMAHGVRIGRKPSDIDIIGTPTDVAEFQENWLIAATKKLSEKKVVFFMRDKTIVEFEIAHPETNPTAAWLLDHYPGLGYEDRHHPITINDGRSMLVRHAHPEVVLALKLSHRYLKNSPHFRKTMDDILALRGLKFRVPAALEGWLKDRQKATLDYGHPSLERNKAKFFSGDGVKYRYEHDDIHKALAVLPNPNDYTFQYGDADFEKFPAYSYFQREGAEVSVDRDKWKILPEEVKLLSVLEESYVLALERSQVPNDYSIAPRVSFLIALEKVCTSITSGWWREYAWENYYRVLGMYSDDYVDRFQKALADGRVRDYVGEAT